MAALRMSINWEGLEKRDTRKAGQREENKHVKYAVWCWWSRTNRQLENGGKDQNLIYIYIYIDIPEKGEGRKPSVFPTADAGLRWGRICEEVRQTVPEQVPEKIPGHGRRLMRKFWRKVPEQVPKQTRFQRAWTAKGLSQWRFVLLGTLLALMPLSRPKYNCKSRLHFFSRDIETQNHRDIESENTEKLLSNNYHTSTNTSNQTSLKG